jgi:hypothetical protein
MPGTARAPKRRPHAPAKEPEHPATVLAIKMHVPMDETEALLRALVLAAHGMAEHGNDDAHMVLFLAREASERYHDISEAWIDLLQIARA